MCLGLRCWCLSLSRVGLVVKSSALEVIFRAREVSGRAEMSLICSINTPTFLRLIAWCSALPPAPAPHQRSIKHQALLFPVFQQAGQGQFSAWALLFYFTSGLLLCYAPFILYLSLHSHIHTHTCANTKEGKKILNRSSETLILNKWGSLRLFPRASIDGSCVFLLDTVG